MARSDDTLFVVLAGVAVYFLATRNSSVPQTYPVVRPSGSLFTPLSNFWNSLFGTPGSVSSGVSNPPTAVGGATDITNINQVGPVGGAPGPLNCQPNGDICDPNDCSYNPDACAQIGPYM